MAFTPVIGALATIDDWQFNQFAAAAYSPVDDVVVSIHGDWTGSGLAVKVNTIDESTGAITVGTSINMGHSRTMSNCQCSYHAAEDKFVFLYSDRNGDEKFRGMVGTVSGGSMNFGSEVEIYPYQLGGNITNPFYSALVYHEVDEKFVAFFTSGTTLFYSVLSVSGLVLSAGSYTTTGLSAVYHDAKYNPITSKIILCYGVGANLYSSEVTISGSTISLGAASTISTSWADTCSLAVDVESGKAVVVYRVGGGDGAFSLLSTSGAHLYTYHSSATGFSWASSNCVKAVYDSNIKKIAVAMIYDSKTYGTSVTISGDTFTLKTPDVIRDSGAYNGSFPQAVYADGAEKVFLINGFGGVNSLYAFTFQIDEDAPKAFWTNFSGQSEMIV